MSTAKRVVFVLGCGLAAAGCFGGSDGTGGEGGSAGTPATPMAGVSTSETGLDDACPVPQGIFQLQYMSLVEGGCGALPAQAVVTLEPGSGGVSQTQVRRTLDDVHTDVTYKGCEIALEQKVLARDDEGTLATTLISSVSGTLTIESETKLTGVVHQTEYDTATGTILCDGYYEAQLVKPMATTGAASR